MLVIDDEPDIRSVLELTLSSLAGWQVLTAGSGIEGIRRAQNHLPDVILLDVMMPDMDGPEVFRRLQALPATADIPVILLTAKLNVEHVAMTHVIPKPFNPSNLPGQIDQALINMAAQWGIGKAASDERSAGIQSADSAAHESSSAGLTARWGKHKQNRVAGMWTTTSQTYWKRWNWSTKRYAPASRVVLKSTL